MNGVLINTQNHTSPGTVNTVDLRIGKGQTEINPFTGYIDEARIYNRVLTPNEILRNYNSGKSKHKN